MPALPVGPPAAGALAGDHLPATAWPAPRRHPTSYPGEAPRYPYLLVDDRVHPLVVHPDRGAVRVTTRDGTPVDDVLRHLGVAPLAERVPVVAYGANRSPDSLALKFAHHGTVAPEDGSAVSAVVPVLAVTVADVDAVVGRQTSQGYVYADIVDSPGTRMEAMLPLLDHRQLAAIHDSEGIGGAYDCAWLPEVDLAGGAGTLGGMAYVGRIEAFRVPDDVPGDGGQPLAFAAVAAEGRRFRALGQVDLMARVVEVTGLTGPLGDLLHLDPGAAPDAVATDLIRLVNGQWWYRHHTGERRAAVVMAILRLLGEAMAASTLPRPHGSPLVGAVLTPEAAYGPPPELHLAHQLPLA